MNTRTDSVRTHYAWVVVGVTFLALLVAAGVRAAPPVLIKPLEAEFSWERAGISLSVALNLLMFGLGAPLSGSLIDLFGPRRIMLAGLVLMALGTATLLVMREQWQMALFWGIVAGIGSGSVANVLGATVAHRWFRAHRGVVVGLFAAASSAGQLLFLPTLMSVNVAGGWRTTVIAMVAPPLLMLAPVLLLMRDRPADVGVRPVGDDGTNVGAAERTEDARGTPLREAARTRDFWLLASSFFICGYTSNGLIGTHLIPHAIEHGFTEVTAATTVGVMGMMNVVGTLASGWLTDRYDNRKLLAAYYGFRAIAIAALPFIVEAQGLLIFAVVYGLDWIATVPPTTNLTARIYGRASLGTLFGWIFFAHMLGAAIAAYVGGFFRQTQGDYHLVFLSAAALGIIAVGLSAGIRNPARLALPRLAVAGAR